MNGIGIICHSSNDVYLARVHLEATALYSRLNELIEFASKLSEIITGFQYNRIHSQAHTIKFSIGGVTTHDMDLNIVKAEKYTLY